MPLYLLCSCVVHQMGQMGRISGVERESSLPDPLCGTQCVQFSVFNPVCVQSSVCSIQCVQSSVSNPVCVQSSVSNPVCSIQCVQSSVVNPVCVQSSVFNPVLGACMHVFRSDMAMATRNHLITDHGKPTLSLPVPSIVWGLRGAVLPRLACTIGCNCGGGGGPTSTH